MVHLLLPSQDHQQGAGSAAQQLGPKQHSDVGCLHPRWWPSSLCYHTGSQSCPLLLSFQLVSSMPEGNLIPKHHWISQVLEDSCWQLVEALTFGVLGALQGIPYACPGSHLQPSSKQELRWQSHRKGVNSGKEAECGLARVFCPFLCACGRGPDILALSLE